MNQRLGVFAAEKKIEIFEQLLAGRPPDEGDYDREIWETARKKEKPQMGVTTYAPHKICFEYIFQDPLGSSVILAVALDPPERVVYMPIPSWVICNIWQGDVSGSYFFESESKEILNQFVDLLSPGKNGDLFDERNLVGKN